MADNMLYSLFNSLGNCYHSIKHMINKIPSYVPYEIDNKLYYTNELFIPIGVTNGNKTVYLTIGDSGSTTFIVGTVGSGKSVALKSILATVINNYPLCSLWLLDLKLVELGMFKNCKQVKVFEYDSDIIDTKLEELLNITLDRYNTLFSNGYTNASDYNKCNKCKMYPMLVVIEEITLLNKKGMKLLTKIASISRACSIYIIYTVQRPSADILSPTLKAITNNKIVFKCENIKSSIIAMDNNKAIDLKGKGNGFLINSYCTEFQGYYISDAVVKEICNKHTECKANDLLEPTNNDISIYNNMNMVHFVGSNKNTNDTKATNTNSDWWEQI